MTEKYLLPAAAVSTLDDSGLKLELHCIPFSHYNNKARWALRLSGLPFTEVQYLPLAHFLGMSTLQRRFREQSRCQQPTASSKSSAATPCLAVYTATGHPICLLQNSNLISRYACLRAAALKLPAAAQLYGGDLSLEPQQDQSSGDAVVVGSGGQYQAIADLELRLSGTLGVEVRRLAYFYLLPIPSVMGRMFYHTSSGLQHWLAWPIYYMSRLMVPRLLNVNAATAARGEVKLRHEFDYIDQLLQQQAQAAEGSCNRASEGPGKLHYYLCGSHLSAADIALACLAAPMVNMSNKLRRRGWSPDVADLPPQLLALQQDLSMRPTGRYVQEMWRLHGPEAQQEASAPLAKCHGADISPQGQL
eukprot:gene5107-5347_t